MSATAASMGGSAHRRASLGKMKLTSIHNTVTRDDKPKKSSLVLRALMRLLSLSYGLFTLVVFLWRCWTMDRRFRVMSKKDRLELEEGECYLFMVVKVK
jgi:hypothetical protein